MPVSGAVRRRRLELVFGKVDNEEGTNIVSDHCDGEDHGAKVVPGKKVQLESK